MHAGRRVSQHALGEKCVRICQLTPFLSLSDDSKSSWEDRSPSVRKTTTTNGFKLNITRAPLCSGSALPGAGVSICSLLGDSDGQLMIMYSASSTGNIEKQHESASVQTHTQITALQHRQRCHRQRQPQFSFTGSVVGLQLRQQLWDGFLLSLSDVAQVLRVQHWQEGLQVPDQLGQH